MGKLFRICVIIYTLFNIFIYLNSHMNGKT